MTDTTTDPVFALIERHRKAYIEHSIICTMPDIREDELESARIADRSARDALANITPTSVAGAAALLRYVAEHAVENEQGDSAMFRMLQNVADGLERLGGEP
jgi:hypothetical protein